MNLKPSSHSYVPVNLESSETVWNILRNRSWEPCGEEVKIQCVAGAAGTHFFTAKIPSSREKTILVPTNDIDASEGINPPRLSRNPGKSIADCSKSQCAYSFWHAHRKSWINLDPSSLVPISSGVPVKLSTVARGVIPTPAILVGDEDNGLSWRLYFRLSDSGAEVEMKVDIAENEVMNGVGVQALTPEETQSESRAVDNKLMNARPGDYFWVFVRPTGVRTEDPSHTRFVDSSSQPPDGVITSYLVRCEATGASVSKKGKDAVSVFSYHDDHRRYYTNYLYSAVCV
jgi:hypothetical protein